MHPFMGITSVDMGFQLAQLEKTNVTYGVLIQSITPGGPADKAGLIAGTQTTVVQGETYRIGGDIITSANGTKILNTDALSSYLTENAVPGDTLVLQVIRNGQSMSVNLILGTRPPAPS